MDAARASEARASEMAQKICEMMQKGTERLHATTHLVRDVLIGREVAREDEAEGIELEKDLGN